MKKLLLISAMLLGISLSASAMAGNEATVVFTAKIVNGGCLQNVKNIECHKTKNGKAVKDNFDVSEMLKKGELTKVNGSTMVNIQKLEKNTFLVQVIED